MTFTPKPSDDTPGPVVYENGCIWWRGSSSGWLWLHRAQAEQMMFMFADEPETLAYAKALARAIAIHDEEHREEEAA